MERNRRDLPDWLFQGDNEVRFYPTDDQDPIGYRVKKVRIVSVPGANTREGGGAPTWRTPRETSLAFRTTMRRPASLRAPARLAAPAAHARGAAQAVSLHVSRPLTGALTAGTVESNKKVHSWRTLADRGLAPGWHTLPLDGLPVGAAIQLKWNPGRDGTGSLDEVRLVSSPLPVGQRDRLTVANPLHGECVDHQAYVRGFVSPLEAGSPRERCSWANR